MKRLIVLLVLLMAGFIAFNRYRLYVRDPLAKVTRAGVPEDGAQVFINYANDVLIENDHAPMYIELIQHRQNAGVPQSITCIHWTACLLDADVATVQRPDTPVTVQLMNNRLVQFRDYRGPTDVSLR